jgi:cold shock CspA family protein
MEPVRWTGVIARFNYSKGYGVIESEKAGEADVFLHQSDWLDARPVQKGMECSFSIGRDQNGRLRAKAARAL